MGEKNRKKNSPPSIQSLTNLKVGTSTKNENVELNESYSEENAIKSKTIYNKGSSKTNGKITRENTLL